MRILISILLLALAIGPASGQVTTAFTYQGELEQGGEPATGEYDFEFVIYDTASDGAAFAGPIVVDDLFVDGGLFHTELDFGPNVFGLMDLWLEIRLREGDSTGMFTALSPRQKITPAPLALNAQNVEVGAVGTEQIATSAVVDDRIADDAITRRTLSADSVGSAEVEDESLTADDIGPDAVGGSEIAANAVGSSEIAPGAVDSNELAAGAVDSNALAASAVGSDQIAAGAVGADQIADGSIPSEKLEQPYQSGNLDLEPITPPFSFQSMEVNRSFNFDPPFPAPPIVTATLQSNQRSASEHIGPVRVDNVSTSGFDVSFDYRTIPIRAADKSNISESPMLEINGHPAIVFRATYAVNYVRAIDSDGMRWDEPMTIIDLPTGSNPDRIEFLVIDDHPAVAVDTSQGELYYIRANDAAGTSWPEPTVLFDGSEGSITDVAMAIVGGVPALAMAAPGEGTAYLAANDAQGSDWPDITDSTVITSQDSSGVGLAEVQGNPAVSIPDGKDLYYARANDSAGTDWPTGQLIVAGEQLDNVYDTSLHIVDGNPAIFYVYSEYLDLQGSRRSPFFIRASDATGSTWNAPVDINLGVQAIFDIDTMVDADGNPALVWQNLESDEVVTARSTNGGDSFGSLTVVDLPPGSSGVSPAIAEVNGRRAFTYSRFEHSELRYIRNFNSAPDTFINWMAIGN